jgi:hypothetical protein
MSRRFVLLSHPTLCEYGYGDLEADLWFGLAAPAKTPHEMLSRLGRWFWAALQLTEVKAKLGVQGLNPRVMSGADFAAFFHKQYDDYGGQIFVPGQQLLVHRPRDVGQDARPIHNGLFAPIPCGGDRPKKCTGSGTAMLAVDN